ncbi:MAG: acyltransferase [Hyphomicrobiaceae bacterium]|nr:acyltransferase [Hyphomicrobiaceae bacterium]
MRRPGERIDLRYKVLDSWRGIAALMVAAFHFPAAGLIHQAAVVRHAFLFVDFFFVLSGFVISHSVREDLGSARATGAFLMRRLGRLYPLYAAVLLAFVGLEVAKALASSMFGLSAQTAPFQAGSPSDPGYLTLHLLLLQAFHLTDGLSWNWPDWSIAAELWTYGLFALVCWLARRQRGYVLALLAATAFVVIIERSHTGIDLTYDLGFVRCVYGFSIGALCYDIWLRAGDRLQRLPATVSEIAVLVIAIGFVVWAGRSQASIVSPFVFAPAVLVFAAQGGRISRALAAPALQRLGQLSYGIYILHAFFVLVFSTGVTLLARSNAPSYWHMETFEGFDQKIFVLPNTLALDGLTLGYLAIVIVVAMFTLKYIEAPARKFANGWTASALGAPGRATSAP